MLPQIFNYSCFACFLADYIRVRRQTQAWFSARWIAKRAAIASPAQLSMLISRKREPSLRLVEQICEALGLEPDETRFAVLLTERGLQRSQIVVNLVDRELAAIALSKNIPLSRTCDQVSDSRSAL